MYSLARDWDGICMGKTIALKISKKEEQVIAHLNKMGMTNSDVLRSALHLFVQNTPELFSDAGQMKEMFVKQEIIRSDVVESVEMLKKEMLVLQEQVERTQQQVENELKTLQSQLSLLTSDTSGVEQGFSSMKSDIVGDIHQQIDEFLKRHTQKNGLEEAIQ
jgi:hypothetical protein